MASQGVLKERRRILRLLEAHEPHIGTVYIRLFNLISGGIDLDEEMKLPPEDRVSGFHWPDVKPGEPGSLEAFVSDATKSL